MYCHDCCRDDKWPCKEPIFQFRLKWAHSFFSLILKQECMGLSTEGSSNQDRIKDKAPLSQLKLSKFHQDLNPHLKVIFRPGYGKLSRYWNSHLTGTMVRHPHNDWVSECDWDNRSWSSIISVERYIILVPFKAFLSPLLTKNMYLKMQNY